MKKVFIAAALAAMIVSCGSKGNKSAEIIAESESDSIFAVNDSTLGELQTYSYEGILPAADAEGINYQLTLQEAGQDSLGTYNLTTTYLGTKDGNQAFTDSGTVVTIIGIQAALGALDGDSVCCLIDSDSDTGRNDDGFSSNSRHCLLPLSYHT